MRFEIVTRTATAPAALVPKPRPWREETIAFADAIERAQAKPGRGPEFVAEITRAISEFVCKSAVSDLVNGVMHGRTLKAELQRASLGVPGLSDDHEWPERFPHGTP